MPVGRCKVRLQTNLEGKENIPVLSLDLTATNLLRKHLPISLLQIYNHFSGGFCMHTFVITDMEVL
jgi:hypothetical protein